MGSFPFTYMGNETEVWAQLVSGLGLCSGLPLGRAVSTEAFTGLNISSRSYSSATTNQGH